MSTSISVFPLAEQVGVVAKVGIAALLGAAVGFERDQAHKSAGVRTHMLVAAAAALAVSLGALVISSSGTGDPTRMMHAVFTGIGFIGAGMIWTSKKAVGPLGLTSAATIMLVAGLGAACGLGAPLIAMAVCLLALVTLRGVKVLETQLRKRLNGRASAAAVDDI